MAPDPKDDYTPLGDPSPAIVPDARSAGEDTSPSPISLTKEAPPFDVRGSAAIPPRRLPLLTSIGPAEMHGFVALYLTMFTESTRLRTQALRDDRDLCTILLAGKAFQSGVVATVQQGVLHEINEYGDGRALEGIVEFDLVLYAGRRSLTVQSSFLAVAIAPPPTANLWAKLAWRYYNAFHDIRTHHVAFSFLKGLGRTHQPEIESVSRADLAYLSIFFADDISDSLATVGLGPKTQTVERYLAAGFAAVTPLAMLARRFLRNPLVCLPLNLLQRLFFYAVGLYGMTLTHRHYYYPTTLRDRHALAEFLNGAWPGLSAEVDAVLGRIVPVPHL
ncbi:hypothetical protein BV20DRAFT_982893 [Pilatotrama ljubarskyi]|nr:hypothetical protein BV20DRAFT_982893 [Pilatotrama ljubarskyi]